MSTSFLPTNFFRDTATVYGRNGSGAWATAVKSSLACRLEVPLIQPSATGPQREELADMRDLKWDPTYVMPEVAQIEIDSVRWNVMAGTFRALRGPLEQIVYRQCDVRRAR